MVTAALIRNPILGYDDLCSFDSCHNVLGAIHVTQQDRCWPTVFIFGNNRVLYASSNYRLNSLNVEYQHWTFVQLKVCQLDCSNEGHGLL